MLRFRIIFRCFTREITGFANFFRFFSRKNSRYFLSGFSTSSGKSTKINFSNSGKYYIDFTATIHSENASSKEIYFWPAVDAVDLANSGMVHTLESNNHRRTISRSGIFQISAGSYLQAMWATDDTDLDLHGLAASAFAPAIPSVTLSVVQVSG